MNLLVYSRRAPVTAVLGHIAELNEQHWSYIDGFADGMTARGPTLGPDRQTWTGSMHVLDLPDPDSAREFVNGDPYHRAGLFEEHFIWRFVHILGRSVWQFTAATNEPRFLVIADTAGHVSQDLTPASMDGARQALGNRLIFYGQLRDLDSDEPAGLALAVQAPTRESLDSLLQDARIGLNLVDIEIHDWEIGGRR